jgi:hypothetical protein
VPFKFYNENLIVILYNAWRLSNNSY